DGAPHRVSKLYYMADTRAVMEVYQSVFGDVVMQIDGIERRVVPWEDWAITSRIDTEAYWRTVWHAISCHRSQLPGYAGLEQLLEQQHQTLLGWQTFYRAFSLVNGGRPVEADLFVGLR